jgi:hypothetical protein
VPINNAPDHPDWNKNVWLQLTWSPEQSLTPSVFVDGLPSQLIETIPLHDSWLQSTWEVVLPYNPQFETVHITGAVDVGELVVDTQCIPEPVTLSLLALSGLAMLRRRK